MYCKLCLNTTPPPPLPLLLQSEMEDLCFAVMHPDVYCKMRAELDRLWSLPTLVWQGLGSWVLGGWGCRVLGGRGFRV